MILELLNDLATMTIHREIVIVNTKNKILDKLIKKG